MHLNGSIACSESLLSSHSRKYFHENVRILRSRSIIHMYRLLSWRPSFPSFRGPPFQSISVKEPSHACSLRRAPLQGRRIPDISSRAAMRPDASLTMIKSIMLPCSHVFDCNFNLFFPVRLKVRIWNKIPIDTGAGCEHGQIIRLLRSNLVKLYKNITRHH